MMGERDFLINQSLLLKSSQRSTTGPVSGNVSVKNQFFRENDLVTLKRDMVVNIAHAGLDIIKSKDPLYKQEMKELDIDTIKGKSNGTAAEADPLVVLKNIFQPKSYSGKIVDKNRIANKYRIKYMEDLAKEERR